MTTTSQALRVEGPRSSLNLQASHRSNSEKVMYRLTFVALAFFRFLPASAAYAALRKMALATALMAGTLLGTTDRAEAITLQELFEGASISALDKDFTGWTLNFNTGTGFPEGADPSQIEVTALEADPLNPGLLFTAAPGALAGVSAETRMQFVYTVTSNGNPIKDNELALIDFIFTLGLPGEPSGPASIIQIGETVRDVTDNFLGFKLAFVVIGAAKLTDEAEFSPQGSIVVTTEFEVDGGQFGIAQVNQFSQRFSQELAALPGIIQEFCTDAGQATEDFLVELDNAGKELKDCFDDFEQCTRGIGTELGCLGDFRRCSERANKDKERACSDFQREFRDAFDDASSDAREQGLEDEFQDSPIVQEKVDIAQSFGALCGAPPDESPAPEPDTVCETALCADNGSPVRAGECGSAVDACRDYAGEDLETCVSVGLFICRGAVLPEDPPPAPEEPPTDGPNLCNRDLCGLSATREQECRDFMFACLPQSLSGEECVGAALLFCSGGF